MVFLTSVVSVVSAVSATLGTVTSGFTVGVGGVVTNPGLGESDWTVTYTAGWATIPAGMRLAVLEMVRHLWRPQRGSTARGPEDNGPGYLVPNRVRELIEPHLLPGFA